MVCDNGIGMPKDDAAGKPGLGTGIVDALTKQLQGQITISDAQPGTEILITHIADVADAESAPVAA